MTEVRWSDVLDRLAQGGDLGEERALAVMRELMSGRAETSQIAGLLMGLRAKGETGPEIAGFVRGMLEAAVPHGLEPALVARLVDTAGTGGDGAGTFNISTLAALVVAAAGVPVAKHGNRAASSPCGSADLLEAWGVELELPPEAVGRVLEDVGISFYFARAFHPAMRHVAEVRGHLGIRTAFNVLGPLSNPAGAPHQVVGVPDDRLAGVMAEALARLGKQRAFVFRGHDGLDELTTTGSSDVYEVREGVVTRATLDPAELGIAQATAEQLRGGDLATNVAIADAVLEGERGPRQDIVALNAAAALLAAGAVDRWAEGLELARVMLDEGHALQVRDRWVTRSRELAGDLDA